MSTLRREIDAYQRALEAYRRRYGSAVREQNTALRNLQAGQRYLVPADQEGKYLIANSIDRTGNFKFDTEKKGGFLGIGRKTVPRVVGEDSGIPVLPKGPTTEEIGSAPAGPDASMAQARGAARPSLAELEGGLIGDVIKGDGVRYGTWFAPKSVAKEMSDQAEIERRAREEEAERRRQRLKVDTTADESTGP